MSQALIFNGVLGSTLDRAREVQFESVHCTLFISRMYIVQNGHRPLVYTPWIPMWLSGILTT